MLRRSELKKIKNDIEHLRFMLTMLKQDIENIKNNKRTKKRKKKCGSD